MTAAVFQLGGKTEHRTKQAVSESSIPVGWETEHRTKQAVSESSIPAGGENRTQNETGC